MKNLWNALHYSWQGLRTACRTDRAFRQELVILLIVLIAAFYWPLTGNERILLIGSWMLVLIVELLNSGLEKTLDRISLEKNLVTQQAKDYGSAAVFLAILLAVMIGLTVGMRYFFKAHFF